MKCVLHLFRELHAISLQHFFWNANHSPQNLHRKPQPECFGRRWKGWQKTWPILGAFYLAAGVAHFTAAESFQAIYPPEGTWGFWYLPGSVTWFWTCFWNVKQGGGLMWIWMEHGFKTKWCINVTYHWHTTGIIGRHCCKISVKPQVVSGLQVFKALRWFLPPIPFRRWSVV